MESEHLRYPAFIALLAVVPVVVFLTGRSEPIVGLSVLSVFVIALSLYYMFSRSDGAEATDGDPSQGDTDASA